MKDTNICYPLQNLGYKGDVVITDQGLIVDRANQSLLQPNKRGLYKLTSNSGKTVYRAVKPLYRQAFGKEYAVDTIEDLEGELWKPIDSRGKYYISNQGRVKSYQLRQAKLLNPYSNQKGYLRVDIKTDSRRTYLVHQLVALAFIPNDNPIEKDTIDHIDLDKTNNRADNLRWLSRADNVRAYQEQKKQRGQNNDTDNTQPKDNQCK